MNIKIEFQSKKLLEDRKKETLNYFQKQGFKLTENLENALRFERGSTIRNMVTFNPLKWKSSVNISFPKDQVIAHFDIDSTYQMVTPKEERMWNVFISNYQKTIETGKSFLTENEFELKVIKKEQWKYIWYAVLGAIIIGIPSAIIAYLSGIGMIAGAGSGCGALLFMMYKVNLDRKNDSEIE